MADDSLTNPTPQFGTAEYAATPGGDRCKSCNQPISGPYYRVNGVLACANCAGQVERMRPKDTHAAFVRGLLFGVGGAFLGLILYATFSIVTGIEIGFVSLAVGFVVGKAILFGSKGIAGRRYQIAAALLTYAAVSMAAVPIGISFLIKDRDARRAAQSAQTSSGANSATTSAPSTPDGAPERPKPSLGALVMAMIFLGLASPFFGLTDPMHGVIGLVILFVGMQIAWKMTAQPRLDISGPFNSQTPPTGRPAFG